MACIVFWCVEIGENIPSRQARRKEESVARVYLSVYLYLETKNLCIYEKKSLEATPKLIHSL